MTGMSMNLLAICLALTLGTTLGGLGTYSLTVLRRYRKQRDRELNPNLNTAGIPVLERLPIGAVVFDSSITPVYQNEKARREPSLLTTVQKTNWFPQAIRDALWQEISFEQSATKDLPIHVNVFLGSPGLAIALLTDESARLETEAIRRDFIANASHELNTPVAAISLLAEAISAATTNPKRIQEFTNSLHEEVERLSHLTHDIVSLSQAQTKEAIQNGQTNNLLSLVAEVVAHHQELAKSKNVELSFQPTIETNAKTSTKKNLENTPEITTETKNTAKNSQTTVQNLGSPTDLIVTGNKHAISIALANLIENAIQYSPSGSHVGIGIELKNNQLALIKVTDQGPGIPEIEQENIFKRFYRLDSSRSRIFGGTGLGLAIARNTARNLGGDINVWSKTGIGSTFTFLLPATISSPNPVTAKEKA